MALVFLLRGPSMAAPPNIVMVLIDDMGWGDFSCFGNMEAKTPNIDRIAAKGIRFSQFYVNSPICSPSRCALITGTWPQRWKITSFLNNRADNKRRGVADWLDPAAPTLPASPAPLTPSGLVVQGCACSERANDAMCCARGIA